MKIEDVLHRRSDLSNLVVHLTRTHDGTPAYERLKSIMQGSVLYAASPMGWIAGSADASQDWLDTQKVVAFTETPLEHVALMTEDIDGREMRFEPYGLAFSRFAARKMEINPIWYVDMTPGGEGFGYRKWILRDALDQLWKEAKDDGPTNPIARLFPFVDPMGDWRETSTGQTRREFWWEREWRHVGNLKFKTPDAIWFAPESELGAFSKILGKSVGVNVPAPRLLDPTWSLDKMVSVLAGIR